MERKSSNGTGARPKQNSKNPRVTASPGPQALVKKPTRTQMALAKANESSIASRYTKRVIKPAKNYDVVSMAIAMNEDFPAQVKELFATETTAAERAIETGLYIAWRCEGTKFDCQRVGHASRCFCDHTLAEHDKFNDRSVQVPCKVPGCACKAYAWIPNRPEDIGEFWLRKRPGFDETTWRAKCKCKHTNISHDAKRPHRCKTRGCPCSGFYSDFLCAACDKHWEEHLTIFESEKSRQLDGLPVGTDWIPFAEMPDLCNLVISDEMKGKMIGYNDEEISHNAIQRYRKQ